MNSAEQEREAVVAWLRECEAIHIENADRKGQKLSRKHHADACHYIAFAIQRGEHLKQEEG